MNAFIGHGVSEHPTLGRRRWWLLAPVLLLNLISAFSFNKFMGAAAYYSARIPITSVTPTDEATRIVHAGQSADRFFLLFAALILLATLLMAPVIRLRGTNSKRFRFPARYILAVVVSILVVGMLAHIFFVYPVALAALTALLMTPVAQDRMSSKGFRVVARYLLALALCILMTGVLVGIMAFLKL
jgi:hypothetical protein